MDFLASTEAIDNHGPPPQSLGHARAEPGAQASVNL
jgi:hypothetical protein